MKTQLIALLLLATVSGWAATASKDGKPPIPADLFCKLPNVDADENAIINWRRAGEIQIPLEEKLGDAIKFCWMPSAPNPNDTLLEGLETWQHRNQEAREIFDASLAKPKAQWPERNPENVQKELNGLILMTKSRLFEADRLAQRGEFTNAVKSLEGSLRLTQLGVDADAALVQYLISANSRALVQGAMMRLAARRDLPALLRERLLQSLPPLHNETNTYAHILSVEFTLYAAHPTDVKKIAETWSKIAETNIAMSLYPEEFRRPFKVLLDPMLVSQHPKPYNEAAAMEAGANHYRIFRTNACTAWTNRFTHVEDQREQVSEDFLKEIEPLMELVKDEPFPLSREAARKARSAYLKIEDPVGRLFSVCSLGDLVGSDAKIFRARTAREAGRTVIALLVFEQRKGKLPRKLSELVDEKIVDRLPYDPFADASLCYSADRRIVWSVSGDAVDDDGDNEEKSPWFGRDAVWQIPELN